MRTVPRNPTERILFYQTRAVKWGESASQIGVTEEQVGELETAVADAKAAMLNQHQAQSAARSATLGLRMAMEKLSSIGSTLMLQIRAKAGSAGSAVYPLAQIAPPAKPSPLEEPGKPTQFEVQLLGLGWLEIGWKCKNPRGSQGTMYEVERQVGGSGPFRYLGTVGTKKFIDHSIPAGATEVTYCVRAIRSKKRGQVALHKVRLCSVSFGTISRGQDFNGIPLLAAAA